MKNYEKLFEGLLTEVNKVIIGQDEMIEQVLVGLLCNSNVLIEGYPGLAKTLTIKTLAQLMDMSFARIQNTPDLMPSDITGTYIIEEVAGKRQFKFQKGPIFANIVLADEINRATPKTQSALLEAMQEKQVTAGNTTFKLDLPFFVLATQNPIEQEGSLALNQSVFVNGQLKTGKELLEQMGESCITEDEKGTRLYDLNAWTLALNPAGQLEKQDCFLYTVPYHEEMIILTTKTGKRITVTKNHPFLVNDQGMIAWKKAEEITKQDYLVNPARITISASTLPELPSHEETLTRMQQKPVPCEILPDEDFAFWIGCILSDGYIGEKCIEFTQKNHPAARDRFIAISKRYGFDPTLTADVAVPYVRIYSKPLIEYLGLRYNIKGGKDKEIPEWFLSWPVGMIKEFVHAFVGLESSLRDNRIVFTQKSEKNTNLIAYMLLRLGILSWLRHDGRVFRLKIQGEDCIRYLKQVGWLSPEKSITIKLDRKIRSSFRVVPVDRKIILGLVERLGLNSFHTLPSRTSITSRPWYGSYKGIKEGETVMSVDSLKIFVNDLKNEINLRKSNAFSELLLSQPRAFAAGFGIPITQIADELGISKNQVWNVYARGSATAQAAQCTVTIREFLQQKQAACLEEAEQMLAYCEALLSEDVYYDGIKSIRHTASDGMAFGLTVPEHQNYLAGFGGCGINHNTYPLPEAQADRFLLKVKIEYPKFDDEVRIVDRYTSDEEPPKLPTIIDKKTLIALQNLARRVPIATDLKHKIVKLVAITRTQKNLLEYGASPRASIGLILAAKAHALLKGRAHVASEDIVKMAYPVLRHRIILNFDAERKGMTTDDVITELLSK